LDFEQDRTDIDRKTEEKRKREKRERKEREKREKGESSSKRPMPKPKFPELLKFFS